MEGHADFLRILHCCVSEDLSTKIVLYMVRREAPKIFCAMALVAQNVFRLALIIAGTLGNYENGTLTSRIGFSTVLDHFWNV